MINWVSLIIFRFLHLFFLVIVKLLKLFMKLIWIQLLHIKLLRGWHVVLVSLHMKLVLQSIQLILFLFPVGLSTSSIWKLLGVNLVQKVTIMGVEVGTTLLVDSSRMRTHTLTIFSAYVHVVLIYQCRILSAVKAHSIILLVTNWRKTSHQSFIL